MIPDKNIRTVFDLDLARRCTEQLYLYEANCSHSGFAAAAEYCRRALNDAGFEKIELLEHDADGKISAFDCTMPPAWDLTGKSFLTVAGEEIILADTDKIPFAAAPWSPPTPPEGITAELVALSPGEISDVRGKWVLLTIYDGKNPQGEFLEQLRQNGAVGVAAVDFLSGKDYPDSIRWFNGTGRFGWYPVAGDQRLPMFAISANCGTMLLKKLASGKVTLHGVMDSRIYPGKICTVTAVIPGESEQEYALFSHIYEPFAADNAIGFGAICAIGKAIRELYGTPKRTLRVVFGMELYGFAAYLSIPERASRISGALNMDAINHKKQKLLTFVDSPLCAPWFGDWVIPEILQQMLPDTTFVRQAGNLSDDTFAGDPLCGGIPVNWCKNPSGTAHHCGCEDFEPDWQWAADEFPAFASAIAAMLQLSARETEKFPAFAAAEFQEQSRLIGQSEKSSGEKLLLLKGAYTYCSGKLDSAAKYCGTIADTTALEKLFRESCAAVSGNSSHSETEARLAQIIPQRAEATPFSLAKIPYNERISFRLPRLLYSLFDGKNSLLDAFHLADRALNKSSSEAEMLNEFQRLKYLEKYGYVTLKQSKSIK